MSRNVQVKCDSCNRFSFEEHRKNSSGWYSITIDNRDKGEMYIQPLLKDVGDLDTFDVCSIPCVVKFVSAFLESKQKEVRQTAENFLGVEK